MDNQHRKIIGYHDLSEEEIALMNRVKTIGPVLELLVKDLSELPETDKRWIAEGKTDLQKGLMSLTRAVARPDFF